MANCGSPAGSTFSAFLNAVCASIKVRSVADRWSSAVTAFRINAFRASISAIAGDVPNVAGLPEKLGAAILELPNTDDSCEAISPLSVVFNATTGSLMGTEPPELKEDIAACICAAAAGDSPVDASEDRVAVPPASLPSSPDAAPAIPVAAPANPATAPNPGIDPASLPADPMAPPTAASPLETALVALPIKLEIDAVPGILLIAPVALFTTDAIAPAPPGIADNPVETDATDEVTTDVAESNKLAMIFLIRYLIFY